MRILYANRGAPYQSALDQVRDLDDLLLDGVLDQLRFIVNVQFAHQVELVGFHSLHAEVQIAGDLFYRVSFGQHLQHFAFTRGERGETGEPVRGLDAAAEIVDQL